MGRISNSSGHDATDRRSGSSVPHPPRGRETAVSAGRGRVLALARHFESLPSLILTFPRSLRELFGPMFGMELRATSRNRRTYFVRAGFLAVLIGVVAVAWLAATADIGFNPAQGRLRLGFLAPSLLMACGWFQLIGLALVGPALTSTAVSEELRRHTLRALLLTPLSEWQILMGKLLSRSLHLLVLAGLSLPVVAAVQVYGGVEPGHVIGTMALGLANGFFAASVGLFVSTTAVRPSMATLTSYLCLVGMYMVPLVAGWCLSIVVTVLVFFGGGNVLVVLAAAINPFVAMALLHTEMMNPGTLPVGSLASTGWLWVPNTIVLLAGACVVTYLASRRTRRLLSPESTLAERLRQAGYRGAPVRRVPTAPPVAPVARTTKDAAAQQPAAATAVVQPAESVPPRPRFAQSVLTGSRAQRPSRHVDDDPILWREGIRATWYTTGWKWATVAVGAYILIPVYSGAAANDTLASGGFHGAMTSIYLVMLLIAAALFSAPALTAEKEGTCWPALLSTPLTGRAILWAKARAALRRTLPFSSLVVGHVLLFTLLGFLHPVVLVHTTLILAAFVPFTLSLGLLFSLRARRTSNAIGGVILTGLVLWGGLLLAETTITSGPGRPGSSVTAHFNPLVWMNASAQGAALGQWDLNWVSAELTAFSPGLYGSRALSVGAFTTVLYVVCMIYLGLAGGLFAYMAWRFNRIVGRTS